MPYRKREVGEKWCVEVEKDGRWERVKCYTGPDAEERAEALRTALHLAVYEDEQKAIPEDIRRVVTEATLRELREGETDLSDVAIAIRDEVAQSIEDAAVAALRKKLTGVMSRLWSEGLAGAVGIVRGTVGDRDAPMTDPADLSGIFSQTVGERITMIEDTTRDRIRRYVKRANEEGYSVNKLAKMIREDSSGAFGRSRARTIARTESGTVYNGGTLEGYAASGIGKVKVLDNEGPNSCKECARANGQVWDIDKARRNLLEHPRCVRAFRAIVSSRYGGQVRPEGAERPVPPNMPPEYGRRLRGEEEGDWRDVPQFDRAGMTDKDKRLVIWRDRWERGDAKPQKEWIESLTPEENKALSVWEEAGYTAYRDIQEGRWITRDMAGNIYPMDDEQKAAWRRRLEALNRALGRAPLHELDNGVVHRGLHGVSQDTIAHWQEMAASGERLTFTSHQSATRRAERAAGFAHAGGLEGRVVWRIVQKTGVRTDYRPNAKYPEEQEVILLRGTRYKIRDLGRQQVERETGAKLVVHVFELVEE